jgi:hypothetical protein
MIHGFVIVKDGQFSPNLAANGIIQSAISEMDESSSTGLYSQRINIL